MRIQGWRVDGFGVFSGFSVDDIEHGLTVITGPNEAGKSTLLAFIRGVLFGFPDGRSRGPKYEPVFGGRHGGALLLSDISGQTWTLERYRGEKAARLIRPDGTLGEDHELLALLGGADANFFGNVYAFGLNELSSFNLLESDAVKDRVFSAAVVGAGQSARAALEELDRRRSILWKPRAACEIRTLANQARERQVRLRQLQKDAAQVAVEEAQVAELAEEVTNRHRDLESNRKEQARLGALIELWPLRNRVAECDDEMAELADLGVSTTLDESTILRFELVEASFVRSQKEYSAAEAEVVAALGRNWPTPLPKEPLLAVAPQLNKLVVDLGLQESRLERLRQLEDLCRSEEADLNTQLAKLGPSWNREGLGRFDASIPTTAQIREYGSRLNTKEQKFVELQKELLRAEANYKHARSEQGGLEEKLDSLGMVLPEADLENRSRALRLLRTNLLELGRVASLSDTEPDFVDPTPPPSSPGRPVSWLIFGLVLLALAVVLGLVGELVAAIVAGSLGLAAALFGATRVSRSGSAGVQLPQQVTPVEPRANLDRLRNSIEAVAIVLGLPPNPSAEDVENYANELAQATNQQTIYRELRLERDKGKRLIAELETALEAVRIEITRAEADLGTIRQEWLSWKMGHQVDHNLSPDEVIDFFTALEHAKKSLAGLGVLEAEATELAARSARWDDELLEVLQGLGLENNDPVGTLQLLRQTLSDLNAAESNLARRKRSLQQEEAALGEVLAANGVPDVASFRVVMQRFRAYKKLEAERDALVGRLADEIGWGDTATEALAELEHGVPQLWKTQLEGARLAQQAFEDNYEAAIRTHQVAESAVQAKLQSSEIADLAFELETLRSDLAGAVSKWQVLSGARVLIEETLATYERERQPAVLRRAEAMFRQITDGHYQQLAVIDGDISVVDKEQRVIAANDLSRGTLEQLYLCLRFGLAAEMASRTPLPFVMDDVLVNFDPERMRQSATVIADIATEQQVFMFTCQPSSVEVLTRVAPDARVIELPRHGGR